MLASSYSMQMIASYQSHQTTIETSRFLKGPISVTKIDGHYVNLTTDSKFVGHCLQIMEAAAESL